MRASTPREEVILTPRQLEVLELLAKGLTNPEIARVLGISRGTAKNHVAAVIDALEVTNRTEAATRLNELGLGTSAGETRDEFRVESFGSRPAIAVLPFDNLSSDPAIDLLADGMVEDLTTGLAQWRWFPVIARNSAFVYKGRRTDVQEVSRALGARYLVEGSLRVAGSDMRVTVQVIDGTNGHHVWAEQFECDVAHLVDRLDSIVGRIVSALEPALARIHGLRATSRRPELMDAWESANRGFFHLCQLTLEGYREAARAYDRALAIDPRFPSAHSGLAAARMQLYFHGISIGPLQQPESYGEAADRAGELDPSDPETHYAIAVLRVLDGDRSRALVAAERAVELGPSDPAAHRLHALTLSANGRPREAADALSLALRLSPKDPSRALTDVQLAGVWLDLGKRAEAETLLSGAIRAAPGLAMPYPALALCKVADGDLDEARALIARMHEMVPSFLPLRAIQLSSSEKNFGIAKAVLASVGWTEDECSA